MTIAPTLYGQRDHAWANDTLGYGPGTLGAFGCYVTSFAMLASQYGYVATPPDLNIALRSAGAFV